MDSKRSERTSFIIQSVLFAVILCVHLAILTVCSTFAARSPYPTDPDYVTLTYLDCDRRRVGGVSLADGEETVVVYFAEYDAPIPIDPRSFGLTDEKVIDAIPENAGVSVVIGEGKDGDLSIRALLYGDETALSYDDFLTAHRKNYTLGALIGAIGAFVWACILLGGVVAYRKKGVAIINGDTRPAPEPSSDQGETK